MCRETAVCLSIPVENAVSKNSGDSGDDICLDGKECRVLVSCSSDPGPHKRYLLAFGVGDFLQLGSRTPLML